MARLVPLLIALICFLSPSVAHADPVSIIIAAVLAGGGAAATAFIAGTAITLSGVFIAAAVGAGLAAASQLLMKGMMPDSASFGAYAKNQQTMVRQPITNRRVIYGQGWFSGPTIYMGERDKNDLLDIIIAVAGHEIFEFNGFKLAENYLNISNNAIGAINSGSDTLLGSGNEGIPESVGKTDQASLLNKTNIMGVAYKNSTKYRNLVRIQTKLGTNNQSALSYLKSKTNSWTDDHQCKGTALAYFELNYNKDIFSQGLPNIVMSIKGKLVRDPRDAAYPSDTKLWTDNAALVLLDYLKDDIYGLGLSESEIDADSFIAGANLADEMVDLIGSTLNDEDTSDASLCAVTALNFSSDGAKGWLSTKKRILLTGQKVRILSQDAGAGESVPTNLSFNTDYYVYGTGTVLFGLATTLKRARAGTLIDLGTDTTRRYFRVRPTAEPRYTINGQIDSSQPPKNIIGAMLTAQAAQLVYGGGKFRLVIGSYSSATESFSDADIIGDIKTTTKISRRNRFNSVRGSFIDPQNEFQTNDFPVVSSNDAITQDGETIYQDMTLEFSNSKSRCQRLAKILLLDSRQEITVDTTLSLKGMNAQAGDTISLTIKRYGWTNKNFKINSWQLNPIDLNGATYLAVQVSLKEVASNTYDYTANEDSLIDAAPDTSLPSAFTVADPALTVTDTLDLYNETLVTKIVAEVTTGSNYSYKFEVQQLRYRNAPTTVNGVTTEGTLTGFTNYTNMGRSTGNYFDFVGAIQGAIYSVRARAINNFNVSSDWVYQEYTVIGKTTAPSNVSGFSSNVMNDKVLLTWESVSDLDLSYYQIRHNKDTTGAALYNVSTIAAAKIARPATSIMLPCQGGTYFIKAYDKYGNQSATPARTVILVSEDKTVNELYKVFLTSTQDPAFTGTKTNTVISGSSIILSTGLFDSATGLFDDSSNLFDNGKAFSTSGEYYFDNYLTFTDNTIRNCRLIFSSTITREFIGNSNFDSQSGFFDLYPNDFDDAPTNDDANFDVQLYYSSTQDDPAASPVWSDYKRFTIEDTYGRAFRFKVVLSTDNLEVSPNISALSVFVSLPKRVITFENRSGTTRTLSYVDAFYALPNVSVTGENFATGNYFTITGRTTSQCVVNTFNSAGTAINRTIDAVVTGYGDII